MDIDLVLAALNKLTTSTPPVLLFVGLIGLGYIWKFIPIFPNSRIPMVNLIAALAIYPFIAKADLNETYSMRIPWVGALVRDEVVAICVFAASWLAHKWALRFIIDRFLPKAAMENGDTKFFRKDPELPSVPLTPPSDSGTKTP